METFSKKELHDNFILIHQYLYPKETIKKWVKDDNEYNGNYHESWEELMVIAQNLCYRKNISLVTLFNEFQKNYLGFDLHSRYHLFFSIICELKKLKGS